MLQHRMGCAIALALVASLLAGASMMAVNAFLPLFLQVVAGTSATYSGLVLAPMMRMPLTSPVSSRTRLSISPYRAMIFSA